VLFCVHPCAVCDRGICSIGAVVRSLLLVLRNGQFSPLFGFPYFVVVRWPLWWFLLSLSLAVVLPHCLHSSDYHRLVSSSSAPGRPLLWPVGAAAARPYSHRGLRKEKRKHGDLALALSFTGALSNAETKVHTKVAEQHREEDEAVCHSQKCDDQIQPEEEDLDELRFGKCQHKDAWAELSKIWAEGVQTTTFGSRIQPVDEIIHPGVGRNSQVGSTHQIISGLKYCDAAEQFTTVVVLAPGIQGQQRHKGCHLEDEVHEHSQSSVKSKGLDCWHGGQGPLDRKTESKPSHISLEGQKS
ncbi:hypothetical protein INR49_025687, partial [Caranx melampygus]